MAAPVDELPMTDSLALGFRGEDFLGDERALGVGFG